MKGGMKVRTRESYFELLGRRVFGTVLENSTEILGPEVSKYFVIIKVTRQDGNIIPGYYEHPTLFTIDDLEEDIILH